MRITDNLIKNKSMDFAIRIVKLYQFLIDNKKEKILASQLLNSGTSINEIIRILVAIIKKSKSKIEN